MFTFHVIYQKREIIPKNEEKNKTNPTTQWNHDY